jgi:hypothetical protein
MHAAAAVAVYALVTALLFRTLLPDIATHLYSDLGDPLLNATILAWNARHWPLSAEWWNFPSFAPLSGVTAFTEHLLAPYPIATPIVWFTGNAILAHNVVMLAAFPLNGWAAYLLARELTGSTLAAFVGGLAFAFAPYQSVHLSHLQTLLAFGMPLALLGLHRRQWPVFGTGWLFTALSNAYMLLFFPLLIALWCAWFIRPREWRRLVAPVITFVVFTLPLVPLLAGYRLRQAAYGLLRDASEIRAFSADIIGLAGVSHREWLWRGLLPHTYEESALFPGVTILALAIAGVAMRLRSGSRASVWPRRLLLVAGILTAIVAARAWSGPFGWRLGPIPLPPFAPSHVFTVAFVVLVVAVLLSSRLRDAWSRRDPVVFYAVAATVLWLLALGPQPDWSGGWRGLAYGPYQLLMWLPGFSSIRVPARAWLPAVLCLAMLAAYGTAALAQRRRWFVALVAVLIGMEGWFVDVTQRVPAPMPAGVIPSDAVVLDLPFEEGFWNALPQYRAVLGGYRTINGYSGYEPPHVLPMRRALADLRVDALNSVLKLTDIYVVIRPGTPDNVARSLVDSPGTVRVADAAGMRVIWLPRLNPEAPRARLPLPLPRPGAKPFGL